MKINKELRDFIEIIEENSGEIRLIGGCVRDMLVNVKSDDIDLACNLSSEKIISICKSKKINVIPTGLKHGTITVVLNGENFEITTLRRDVLTDGRHAKIEFTDNWFLDAARRDFTFNAISLKISGERFEIFDYFNGANDLKNGILRFIGNPEQRIREDYLRILRAFRFYARFCFAEFDQNLSEIIRKNSQNIEILSGERIKTEIFNIFSKKNSAKALNLIDRNHINFLIFGKSNQLKRYIMNFEFLYTINKFSVTKNPVIILSLLIYFNNLDQNFFKNRWKISIYEQKTVKILNDQYYFFDINEDFKIIRQKIKKMSFFEKEAIIISNYVKYSTKKKFDSNEFYEFKNRILTIKIKKLPINGNDLKNLNLFNEKIGIGLEIAENFWNENDYNVSRDEILEFVKQNIQQSKEPLEK